MEFRDYINEGINREIGFVNFDFTNPFLDEAVIHVNSKSYINVLFHIDVDMEIKNCENINQFIDVLNKAYKSRKIEFILKQNSNFNAQTNKQGIIKIFVNNNFLLLYKTKQDKFINKFKEILDHELIHREQSKRINWDNYNFIKILNRKQYLSNKQEIMAYAKNIINQLELKFYSDIKIIKFLHSPYREVSNYLDLYLENFDKNDKVIKRLYKYMYEYLIRDNNEI